MTSFLKDQAGDEEFRIRQGLGPANVKLFFELNLDEDELRRCQELFGRLAVSGLRVGTYSMLINKYPALTLATLVGHAGLSYEQGRYWEGFWDELGLERDQEFENALRHSLGDLLRKFSLREFPEFPARNYVMAMAMHAGIPVHCLGDLVDIIEEHVEHGRDATGAAVLEWLTEPSMDYRLSRLDVPVRNFLRYGGEIAVDILDRMIEFLVFTLEQPEVWNDLDLDTSTTGLPTVLLNGLIERLHDRPFLSASETVVDTRTIRRRRGPAVTFSVEDDEVLVGVPYPRSDGDSPWKVTVGGTTREVYAERGWGVDDGEHPHTPVTVTAPSREVMLQHEASGAKYTVHVFDTSDPLLLFTHDGRLVARHTALPRGLVLAVHPKDASVVDAVTGESVRAVDDARVPAGWTGWRVQSFDLSDHSSIVVKRPGRADGFIRGVRSVGSPRIGLPEPVLGLHTTNGLSVYGERPHVELPAHLGNVPEDWRVRARRVGDREWLADCIWVSDTDKSYLDPFDGVEEALLGQYEVVVSGAVGSDLRQTLFLAEGLELEHDVAFRQPTAGGLSAATTTVTSEYGIPVDRTTLAFAPTDRETQIRVGSAGHAFKLVVRPPYFEVRIDRVGTPAQWRTTAQAVTPADLEEHAVIAVRVPSDVSVTFALVDGLGRPVQEEAPDRQQDNVFQVGTRRFVDTARRVGICQLVALVDDAEGVSHHLPLAEVRPARLCEAVALDGHHLVFDGLAEVDDLAAWVWAATAPWRPLTRLDIAGDRATLPVELRDAGNLIVQVFVDDPFTVVARPDRPDRDALGVSQPGWFRGDIEVLDDLSRYLSAAGQPPLLAEAAAGAWSALAVLPWISGDAESERIRGGLFRILGRNPRSALEALGSSTVPQDSMMALLIRTQLVDRPYSASFTLNDLHPNPWVGCMVEISDLPALLGRGRTGASERAETLGYLEAQGGQELMGILRAGKMSDPRSAVFDRNVLTVAAMGDEQAEQLFEHFRLVPGALLDIDTRTSATVDAFRLRAEWMADKMCGEMPAHARRALREVEKVSPVLHDLVAARDEALHGVDIVTHPWMMLSLQSLTFAAVARLEARGEFDHPPMTSDMREAWAVMAEYFPAMVAGDLLIAEAFVAHLTYGDLIGAHA